MIWRRRAAAAEEQRERAIIEQQQAEHEGRLAKREKDKSVSECLSWREKYQALADIFRAQEDLISQRQNKAVSQTEGQLPSEPLQTICVLLVYKSISCVIFFLSFFF